MIGFILRHKEGLLYALYCNLLLIIYAFIGIHFSAPKGQVIAQVAIFEAAFCCAAWIMSRPPRVKRLKLDDQPLFKFTGGGKPNFGGKNARMKPMKRYKR